MVQRWLFALVVCTLAHQAMAAEPYDTLADRLKALKKGWSFASDQPEQPAEKAATRGSASVSDDAGALPRVDPREVLPRRWFGEGVAAPASSGRASAAVTDQSGAVGTARSRLLRDLRAGANDRTPRVAGRSLLAPSVGRRPIVVASDRGAGKGVARAGSVLSQQEGVVSDAAATTTAEGPAKSSASAALAKAIAADVAESMTGADTPADTSGELTFDDLAAVDLTAETDAVSPTADDASDEAGFVAREPLRVAANPKAKKTTASAGPSGETTKLPLFIGDRYAADGGTARVTKRPSAPVSDVVRSPDRAAGPESSDQWLLTQAAPMLVSRVQGPRSIVVGREATYRVVLANRGDADAEDLITRVTIPAGAEVIGASSQRGQVSRSDDGAARVLVWEMDRLGTEKPETLELRLIARTGQPIELGVACEHRPVDAATVVQVQEPKLDMQLAGPDEVLFGKPQVYRLTLSNPGTGVAEDVVLRLTPPGQQNRTTTHSIGELAPGASRTVEIELVAREAGNLMILAEATAAGDVRADAQREILCRKPELVVDWRGPDERYAGAPALYYFRVRNPGSATAPGVELSVELPQGFRVLNAGDGRTAVGRQLTYRVGALQAGDDRYFELRGVFDQAGANELVLQAAGSDETRSDSVVARTEVVALADLKLDVLDPKGPIATGQEIDYQIRVTNRGANAARDVRVVGLFSEGIEPIGVEGGISQIEDGRVAFETIATLPAGAEQVFTIRARAEDAGTHRFRAEVLCRDLEIKLAAEETTRFFRDDSLDVAADGGGYYPR